MTSLSDYFRAQADWRRRKAEQYPTDPGNPQAAEALEGLADYVDPTDHGAAEAGSLVDQLQPHLRDGSLGGQKVAREVARYGYGYPVSPATHERFLESLLPLCMADAYEQARENEADPTGQLHDFELEAAGQEVPLPPTYWEVRPAESEKDLRPMVAEFTESFHQRAAGQSREAR